jgi:hypothetical protein
MKLQRRSIPFINIFESLSLAFLLWTPKAVYATIDCGELAPDVCPQTNLIGNKNTFECNEEKDKCYFQTIRGVEGLGSICKSTPIPEGTKSFVDSLILTNNTSPPKNAEGSKGGLVCLRTKIYFNDDFTEPHGMICQGNTACQDATIVAGPKGLVTCKASGPGTENATSIATAPCTSSGYMFPDSEIGALVIQAGCLRCVDKYSCGENVVFIDATRNDDAFEIIPTNYIGTRGSGCSTLPSPNNCFSPYNTVQVQGKGIIPIRALQIGDYVKSSSSFVTTGKNDYSRVVAFMHKNLDEEVVEYLQIYTDQGKESSSSSYPPLEITPEHYLYLGNGKLIQARDIRVGDILDSKNNHEGTKMIVTNIQTVHRRGMLAPLTESGDVVVSGIHTSCYVALLQDHTIAPTNLQAYVLHATLTPLRMACALDFSICQQERYTMQGFSTNIQHLIQFGLRLFELNGTFQLLVLIIALPFLTVQTALEIGFNHGLVVLSVAGCLTVLYKRIGEEKIRAFWVETQNLVRTRNGR